MNKASRPLTCQNTIPDGPASSRIVAGANLHRAGHPRENILVIAPFHFFLWMTLIAAGLVWAVCHFYKGPISDWGWNAMAFAIGLPALAWLGQQFLGTRIRFDRSTGKVQVWGAGHTFARFDGCPLVGVQFCRGKGQDSTEYNESVNSFQVNLIVEQNGAAVRYNILDSGDQDAMLKFATEIAAFMSVDFISSQAAIRLDQPPPKPPKKRSDKTPARPPIPGLMKILFLIPVLLVGGIWLFGKHQQRNAQAAIEQVLKLGGKNDSLYSRGDELAPHFFNVDFSGKPITDADLATLRPFFLNAGGPSKLDLSGTRVTDAGLRQLAGFTFLHELILDETAVTGSGLADLKSIGSDDEDEYNVHIGLARSKMDDAGLAGLAAVQYLGEVDLSRTQISGSGLTQLKALNRLSTLKLAGCPIDDKGLDSIRVLDALDNLYDWDFSYTQITDAGLSKLMNVKHLRSLKLSGTKITDSGLPILNARKELTGIFLDRTAITDSGLKAFSGNATLTQLSLSGTAITDNGILQLKANNRIEHLYLDQTAANDATLRAMANWTTIKSLNLEYTQITDAGLAALADLPNLERLYLKLMESKMTREGIDALKRRKPNLAIDD